MEGEEDLRLAGFCGSMLKLLSTPIETSTSMVGAAKRCSTGSLLEAKRMGRMGQSNRQSYAPEGYRIALRSVIEYPSYLTRVGRNRV